MIFRLLLWLLMYGGGAAVAYGGYKVAMAKLVPWRERRLEGKRAALQLTVSVEQKCAYCDKRHPAPGLYDEKIGWFHTSCYLRAVDDA